MIWLKRILIFILLSFFVLALFFLYAGKNKDFGRQFLKETDSGGMYKSLDGNYYLAGDLFGFSEIDRFKEKINITNLQKSPAIEQADIILKGDSFFNTGYDSEPVPNSLQNISGKKVFYLATPKREITPLQYLKEINYQAGSEKYFIVETIERSVVERANALSADFKISEANNSLLPPNKLSDFRTRMKQLLFDRIDVEFFIKNNYIFKPINSWFKNRAFIWFGEINSKTPLYLDNPKMLFFDGEIKFTNDKNKLDSINSLAENISQEAKLIKEKYNLTLIYLIIPNKYSVYGELSQAGKKYDDFIPKLQEQLALKNVKYLDIYNIFINFRNQYPEKLLYYAGDTHYTPLGKSLLVNEIIKSYLDK